MKRSDWLNNKEAEVYRPARLFNLTDEIIDEIKKNHKATMGNWPESRIHYFIGFLEGLPEYLADPVYPGTDYGIKPWTNFNQDPQVNLWAFKTGPQGCIVNLVINQPGMKWNHSWIVSKNALGDFVIDTKMSYPTFEPAFDPIVGRPFPGRGDEIYPSAPIAEPERYNTEPADERNWGTVGGTAGIPSNGEYTTSAGTSGSGGVSMGWSTGR